MKGVRALARGWRTVQFLAAPSGVRHDKKNVTTNHGAQHLSENFVIRLVREKGGLSCVREKKGGEKMLPISDPAFRMLKEVTRALPDHVPGWRGLADHNGPPRSVEF